MTRGKHSNSSANRATIRVTEAEDKARNAEIRANRLSHTLAERDAEIERLKEAVTQARIENTTPGTYTEADMAKALTNADARHRAAVGEGFKFLSECGAPAFIPMGRLAELAEAFACQPADIFASTSKARKIKRFSTATARLMDEAHRQGVLL